MTTKEINAILNARIDDVRAAKRPGAAKLASERVKQTRKINADASRARAHAAVGAFAAKLKDRKSAAVPPAPAKPVAVKPALAKKVASGLVEVQLVKPRMGAKDKRGQADR